jgi:hypothetical protein
LKNAECEHIERRTKIDIVFEKVVEEVVVPGNHFSCILSDKLKKEVKEFVGEQEEYNPYDR